MKISVVTISFNQASFLERTIQSVLYQKYADLEYIIADPGSTDGSREIIERYRPFFSAVLLDPDKGPGDGLNKGFARATGDIFFYLNSDDTVLPGAFARAAKEFEADSTLDVLCGHAWAVDQNDVRLRRIWSDPWTPCAQAYGAAIQMQPSTYIRAEAFWKVGGFNIENLAAWDTELLTSICLTGARMKVVPAFMSNYRLHTNGLTGSGGDSTFQARQKLWTLRQFRSIMKRDQKPLDCLIAIYWKILRQLRNPKAFWERLRKGPVFRRYANDS